MKQQDNLAAQTVKLDFGDEVLYAFDYLPINHQLNAEITQRAVERAKSKQKWAPPPQTKKPRQPSGRRGV